MTAQTPRPIGIAAVIGAAVLAFVAGVMVANHSRPDTWEECYVDRMADAKTKGSTQVLASFCRSQVSPKQKPQ